MAFVASSSGVDVRLVRSVVMATDDAAYARAVKESTQPNQPKRSLAYDYSILLIIFALLNDKDYSRTMTTMLTELELISDKAISLRAWLRGRVVYAAKVQNDQETLEQQIRILETELAAYRISSNDKPQDKLVNDKYSAWAWGYFAIVRAEHFSSAVSAADEQMQNYLKQFKQSQANQLSAAASSSRGDPSETLSVIEERGRVIWALILLLPAAAQISQNEYKAIVNKILTVADNAKSLSNAIVDNLLEKNQDFPRWALAIAFHAARLQQDPQLQEIEHTLRLKLSTLKPSDMTPENKADSVLATATYEHAKKLPLQQQPAAAAAAMPAFSR